MTRKPEIERIFECIQYLLQDSPRVVVKMVSNDRILVSLEES